jgi:IS5 family transposase
METVSRTHLYQEVWSEPVRTVAGRYHVSDVALAKACKKWRIPLPPRGYWAKIRAGHHLARPPLPRLPDIEGQTIRFEGDQREPSPEPGEEASRLIEAEKRPEAKLHVAEQLTDPHPEVRKLSKSLRPERFGNGQRPGILSPDARPRLDVSVYPPSVDRALRIMDALLKALEARGWPIDIEHEGKHSTSTVVLEERVFFFLDEKTARSDHIPTAEEKREAREHSWRTPPKWDFKPSGLLRLQIIDANYERTRTVWTDGEKGKQRLEALLNDFLIGAVKAAEGIKRRRAQWAAAEKRRKEEAVREIERQQLRYLEETRARELDRQTEAFERVTRIRAYLAKAREAGRVYLPMEAVQITTLQGWIDWATTYADRIDPFRKEAEQIGDSE